MLNLFCLPTNSKIAIGWVTNSLVFLWKYLLIWIENNIHLNIRSDFSLQIDTSDFCHIDLIKYLILMHFWIDQCNGKVEVDQIRAMLSTYSHNLALSPQTTLLRKICRSFLRQFFPKSITVRHLVLGNTFFINLWSSPPIHCIAKHHLHLSSVLFIFRILLSDIYVTHNATLRREEPSP